MCNFGNGLMMVVMNLKLSIVTTGFFTLASNYTACVSVYMPHSPTPPSVGRSTDTAASNHAADTALVSLKQYDVHYT